MGLLIKGQITPRKMKSKIDQAISKLDPDIKIDFKSIEVKLSDWGWPQPYLEIHDIRLSPVQRICDESQIYIDTVSFPLTWNIIFESKKIIKSLRMNQLEIRLSEFKNCFSMPESKSAESALKSVLLQIFTAHNSGQLEVLKVDRIKLLSKGNYQTPLFLQAAVFKFLYSEQTLNNISLRAQILSYRDDFKNIFKLRSDLNIQIFKKNKSDISIEGQANGKIIDRSYDVKFNYDLLLNHLVFDAHLNQIAVKTLIKFLDFEKNSTLQSLNTYFSNYFLTLKGSGFFDLNKNKMTEFKVKNILIESQDTSLKSKNLVIEDLSQLHIGSGSQFQIENFDLKSFFNENIKQNALLRNTTHFGKFTGKLEYVSEDQIIATGQMTNFEFDLKYNNEKWPLKIDSSDIKFESTNQSSDIVLSEIIFNKQPIYGQIYYSVQQQKYNMQLNGKLLSPALLKKLFSSDQENDFIIHLNNKNSDQPTAFVKANLIQWTDDQVNESDDHKNLTKIFDQIFQKNQQIKKSTQDPELTLKILKNIELTAAFADSDVAAANIMIKSKKNDQKTEIHKISFDINQQNFKMDNE